MMVPGAAVLVSATTSPAKTEDVRAMPDRDDGGCDDQRGEKPT
jgi:hypothetical protein